MQKSLNKLHRLNLYAAGLHAIQAIAIIVLSKNVTFPISVNFLSFNAVTQSLQPASKVVFNLPLAWLIVLFFALSAIFHTIVSTLGRRRYEKDLKVGINRFRWYEYSLSASTMIVAIGILSGIYDLGSLIALFALVMVMNLCGLVMEVHNQTTKQTKWISYVVGCIAGIVPWVVIGLYFWAASAYGGGNIPTFVYWIYVSIFVFFNCFALNMFLQYKGWGPWKNYLFGERVYIWLSLIAKSILAWQVFFGALRP